MNGPLTYDYRPPLDAKPLAIERVVETRAADLMVDDVIAQAGFVSIIVTGVQSVVCGLTSVSYACTAGCGTRVYPSEMVIQVRRIETVIA